MTKGHAAEEALRRYFLGAQFFVVRGAAFEYAGYSITDVDLWLYQRGSLLTRERINVDIKNRKTPQAIERIFWAKGLQEVLGLDRAFVATTDNRTETQDFGLRNGVTVLRGKFVSEVVSHFQKNDDRLSEEQFIAQLGDRFAIDQSSQPGKVYQLHKGVLLTHLDFNGANRHLKQVRALLEELLATEKPDPWVYRLLFVLVAYLLVTLDFCLHHLGHEEPEVREAVIAEGLRYGNAGKRSADRILEVVVQLIRSAEVRSLFSNEAAIRENIESELGRLPVESLAEYVARTDVSRRLFALAKTFEALAFGADPPDMSSLDGEQKSIVAVLVDLFGMDRKHLL